MVNLLSEVRGAKSRFKTPIREYRFKKQTYRVLIWGFDPEGLAVIARSGATKQSHVMT